MKAMHIATKKCYAIKLVKDCFKHEYRARLILREIKLLRKLTEMGDNNIFTTDIIDIILPVDATLHDKNSADFIEKGS